MVYHSIRQLNLMNYAYRLVKKVNVFHQQPLYAFSALSMRTALFLVGMIYFAYIFGGGYEASGVEDAITVLLRALFIPLSAVIVLLPLWGIHQRISQARDAVREENSVQIDSVRTMLYKAIDAKHFKEIQGLNGAVDSLYKEREQLKSIPTWPWAPGSFRNFLSAVLLPMIIWGMQIFLSRFLG
jgi:hypothetical protein